MAWFKADDRICEHPKFIAARARGGHSVVGVWFHAGTWSNAMQTDGFIPRTWAMLNGAEAEAVILVDVGLWHEDASRDGWRMHDYAEYQPTRAELQAKSEQKRSAGQAGGKQSASRRVAKGKPVPVPEPEPVTSLRDVNTRGISPKEARTRKRLGLEAENGGTA